jgi:AcrR family transcriptional regulator
MNGKPRKTPIRTQQVRHAQAARARISEPGQGLRARRDPAQERSRKTVDAIVEAAGRLLVEHGRLGVTTNAVAERAGVSIGSLYQYFPNKEAIFAALQERHRAELQRIAAPHPSATLTSALTRSLAEMTRERSARGLAIESLWNRPSAPPARSFQPTPSGTCVRNSCSCAIFSCL